MTLSRNRTTGQQPPRLFLETEVRYMIHHVFLPSKLPQKDDLAPSLNLALADIVLTSLQDFCTIQGHSSALDTVTYMMENYRAVHDDSGGITQAQLANTLAELSIDESKVMALHVKAQNAGIIVRRDSGGVFFEVFELSPNNNSVVSTKGRLKRSFPAFAVYLSLEEFSDHGFQTTFSQTVSRMSTERVDEMQPKVRKAGENQSEMRDTAKPHLVTEHLVSFLRAIGEPAGTTIINKATREEVQWHNAKNPWRRSAMWLLVRVAMQLSFYRLSENPFESLYKPFMVFLMSRILKLGLDFDTIDSDVIYSMNAKISQRLLKVGAERKALWLDSVWKAMTSANSHISSRWKLVMANSCPEIDLSALCEVRPAKDTVHELPQLDKFLVEAQDLSTSKEHSLFKSPGSFPSFDPDHLPSFFHLDLGSLDRAFGLAALETWVELCLETWLNSHINEQKTCVKLQGLIKTYHQKATVIYRGNPEALSLMVLTIMDLWVACDKVTCRLFELLTQFDHEISPCLLWSLLLPLQTQLSRVSKIELYLQFRTSHSNKTFVSPFRDFGHPTSFGVQFFNQSSQHQLLLAGIEEKARQQKADKEEEVFRLNQSHAELMSSYESSCCEFNNVTEYRIDGSQYESERHDSRCKKCDYLRQANDLKVCLHEWPVSQELNKAKGTVFELDVPPEFASWRDLTHYILQTILGYKYETENPVGSDYTLQRDPGIKNLFSSSNDRVEIRSRTKPSTVTHRNPVSIPTTPASVCLANGLSYQYCDINTGNIISPFVATEELHRQCSFVLPTHSRQLQKFLRRTPSKPNGLEPNEVMASLSECPDGMSLDEFKSFALVPLGYELQWQNVLSQLAVPSIDFTKEDTTILLLQISQQIGPNSNSISRASHEVLCNERFSASFLQQLCEAKRRVGDNWESFQAIAGLVCLAARLLASSTFSNTKSECLDYLKSCRSLLFSWLVKLRAKVQGCTNDDQRAEFAAHTVEIALICVSSFGVDREHFKAVLCQTPDASVFLQCSITIQEHILSVDLSLSSFARTFLARWKQLVYKTYPELSELIVNLGDPCLDLAIKEFWADYLPGSKWQQLPAPEQHWIHSSTSSDGHSDSLPVHFNLLTAELLVNGAPLAKLPAQYEEHAMYPVLFGRSHIQVMPSSRPGFHFSSRCEYAGHLIHFSMLGDDMLLYAVSNGCAYSLVPPCVLVDKLPQAFVKDYVHWFDHESQTIIFVPIKDPWSRDFQYWRLSHYGAGWELKKGNKILVNIRSRTSEVISKILSPLEDTPFLHVFWHAGSRNIHLDLPRLRLSFYFKTGYDQIFSCQFRDMSIDPDQNFGSLFGLTSKLVLRSNDGLRRVLIPEGHVSYERRCGHTFVSIGRGVSKIHSYCVDDQLGRLLGSGSMQSMLLLCYLHSVTSYCLPDPLTRNTGTEQALTIITSAAVRSFDLLDQDNLNMLERIAKLAPKRHFYPQHLQDMQTVHWDPELSFLSQHSQLYLEVHDIFSQALRSKPLHQEFIEPPSLDWTRLHLVERDLIRSSTFRVSGFGAEQHTDKHDASYQSRDRGQQSERAQRSLIVARSICKKDPILHIQSLLRVNDHLWKELSKQEPIPGPQTLLNQNEIIYAGHLLGETAPYLASKWCSGHIFLSGGDWKNTYSLMMWLSTIAFARKADMLLIQTFVAFYCIPALAQLTPPRIRLFNVKEGIFIKGLAELVQFHPLDVCPEAELPPLARERADATETRRRQVHQKKQQAATKLLVRMVEAQWPSEHPTRPSGGELNIYIKVEPTMTSISPRWREWWHNLQFHKYLSAIESECKAQPYEVLDTSLGDLKQSENLDKHQKRHIRNQDIFDVPPPHIPDRHIDNLARLVRSSCEPGHSSARVESLLAAFEGRLLASHERQYLNDLQESITHLNQDLQTHVLEPLKLSSLDKLLNQHQYECRKQVQELYSGLLGTSEQVFKIASSVSHAPRKSQRFYLEQLSHLHWPSLSNDWRKYLLRYAKALRALQRAERLIRTSRSHIEFVNELVNIGDQGWDSMEFPGWLLLEVESGLCIREVQASISKHMISPETGRNSVMQLNMGEGKSTVIVPAVATALADGQNLVRVFVARPQSKQMFQMLVSKLSGLLGRRVYHMPISRSLRLTLPEAESVREMCEECLKSGGVLLVQPEHVLSFKLMAIESIINGDTSLGRSLLRSLYYFDTRSRDIIDESDENFSVKFELIYTMGLQQPIEFSPDRWILMQHILGLVAKFVPKIALEMGTDSIEVEGHRGRFPRTRILQPEAGARLRMMIAKHICEFGLFGFPVVHQSAEMRRAILKYITEPNLSPDEIAKIEDNNSTVWNSATKSPLLLIRGLLAGSVLDFVLSSKRWRVNYGLDQLRVPPTRLAIPFRAKDCPSPRSEFSHPDVVIFLTCLSYYYGGLSNEDLFDNFQLLLRADQADVEYRIWTESALELPEKFRHLSSINLKDRLQCVEEVFPKLRFSKGAIDYFLSHYVFQKYIKEFPHKISASGWDLGQVKSKPTTGFSGTIDSRHLLPLDVYHLDLDRQKHTNALVLKCILQPENSIHLLPLRNASSYSESQISSADVLLQTVHSMRPAVRVILDVGAQILEMNNREVVEKWLDLWEQKEEIEAAVFFNDKDEISVIDTKGQVELLQVSPYANRLDVCLIFLDEAHTRGTDLRLPANYRAAVTLGPDLTKDRLVQACWRMRKLGKGQSVVFCIPDEIRAKIFQLKQIGDRSSLGVLHVLSWSIFESFGYYRRSIPLWKTQGQRFIRQSKVWEAARGDDCIALSREMAEQFLEDESQSLEHRYRPLIARNNHFDNVGQDENFVRILQRCSELNISNSESAALEEEQERELSPEMEEEREVEKPASAKALKHFLHKDLLSLATTGNMTNHSKAWLPAFCTLRKTTAAEHLDTSQFPGDLLVTADFAGTVQPVGKKFVLDSFLRPIQWILTSVEKDGEMIMMIISPFEAQKLLPLVRKYTMVTLHIYLPRPSLQFKALDSLELFTEGDSFTSSSIPRHLSIQLNLFAGQLYLGTFEEYTATCDFLGLAWQPQEEGVEVASDGFIFKSNSSSFTTSPVKFLYVLMTKIRRNCDSIEKTHVGRILSGTLLESTEFNS